MATWPTEVIARIATTDEVRVAPLRRDGRTYRTATVIWAMVVDARLFVRAHHGPDAAWFRLARAQGRGRLTAAGTTHDVVLHPVDDVALGDRIDAAYRGRVRRQPVPAGDGGPARPGRDDRGPSHDRARPPRGGPMRIEELGERTDRPRTPAEFDVLRRLR